MSKNTTEEKMNKKDIEETPDDLKNKKLEHLDDSSKKHGLDNRNTSEEIETKKDFAPRDNC